MEDGFLLKGVCVLTGCARSQRAGVCVYVRVHMKLGGRHSSEGRRCLCAGVCVGNSAFWDFFVFFAKLK